MEKKYILTTETKDVNGHTLHRIQAIRDFNDVKTGDLGGWIEKEKNLLKAFGWLFITALGAYKTADEAFKSGQFDGITGILEKSVPNDKTLRNPDFNDYITEVKTE